MKYFLPVFLIIFLTACAQKNTSFSKSKEPIYFQHLKYTKVSKVLKGEDVKTVVNATYLNSADHKKYNKGTQNFLICVYYTDDKDIAGYSFSLNGHDPLSITEIKKNDPLYKNIAMRNSWAKYYLYSFKDIKEKNLTLVFNDLNSDNLKFSFIKE